MIGKTNQESIYGGIFENKLRLMRARHKVALFKHQSSPRWSLQPIISNRITAEVGPKMGDSQLVILSFLLTKAVERLRKEGIAGI